MSRLASGLVPCSAVQPDHACSASRCYAHLTPGLEVPLAAELRASSSARTGKLGLAALRGDAGAGPDVVALSAADATRAAAIYAAHYPGHWFEPASLERGPYLALWDAHGLAAIAGVHVYSPTKRVAAIGNVATRGDARGARPGPAHHGRVVPAVAHRGRRHRPQRAGRQRARARVLPRPRLRGGRRVPRVALRSPTVTGVAHRETGMWVIGTGTTSSPPAGSVSTSELALAKRIRS